MARAPKILRVVVNPFAHLDHEGRPACAVAHEPNPAARGTELKRHHGAVHHAHPIELRAPVVVTPNGITGDPRKSVHEHTFEFSYGEILTLPDTHYYREHLTPSVDGATPLLPADEATAKKLGVPFRKPELTIHETATQAAKRWAEANDGEQPEFVTVDHAKDDEKLQDVHPAHVRAARYLAKISPSAKPAPSAPPAPDKPGGSGHDDADEPHISIYDDAHGAA